MFDISNFANLQAGKQLEAKKASGGLPGSIWQTYSAFANTSGGVILLGVEEKKDKSLHIVGLQNPEKMLEEFWGIINNKQKVSSNILFDKHVQITEVEGKRIIMIEVPRAELSVKPVYLNEKPFAETYRRNGQGDYHCSEPMIKSMFRENGLQTPDMKVLTDMTIDVFDYESVKKYRKIFITSRPVHIWNLLDDLDFLQKIGAIKSNGDGKQHPTAAGLLMFGSDHEILHEYSNYFLDYSENFDPNNRYTDRFVSCSGDWSGNLFDFYFRVINKLFQNIKTSFHISGEQYRVEDTPIRVAIREALLNCLLNADYHGERGILVRNYPDKFIFENPGGFRISLPDALSGGISSPRNSVLMKMFYLIGLVERYGSGIPIILSAWAEQGWETPTYKELFDPDRTILTLSFDKRG